MVKRWFREPALYIALIICALIHATRFTDRSLQGEEPRRGLVAAEMIWTGDWLVPRTQGRIFLSRPPLQNWVIGGIGMIRGQVDVVAIRLPSVISLLLMVTLIYGYARRWLPTHGATIAALSYATMGQVLELGSSGETESFYTFLVAGSLLLWHGGYTSRRSTSLAWVAGYGLAAAGMLTKGPQAPVYFVAAVFGYLLLTKNWRDLFTRSHAIGIATFVLLWSAWNVPFWNQVGFESMVQMYRNDIALRFEEKTWTKLFSHMGTYPIEVFVCLMPWACILPIYGMPGFWRSFKQTGPHKQTGPQNEQRLDAVIFSVWAIAVCFLSVWLTTGAKSRYFMPLYPCFSVLIGIGAQQCLQQSNRTFWSGSWRRMQLGLAVAMLIGGISLFVSPSIDVAPEMLSGFATAIPISMALLALGALMWKTSGSINPRQIRLNMFAATASIGLIYTGLAMNLIVAKTNTNRVEVAKAKNVIPTGNRVVSIGNIQHAFAYHFQEPIEVISDPSRAECWPKDAEYFCFTANSGADKKLPFPWTPVSKATLSRTQSRRDAQEIVIGRRLSSRIATTPDQPSVKR